MVDVAAAGVAAAAGVEKFDFVNDAVLTLADPAEVSAGCCGHQERQLL